MHVIKVAGYTVHIFQNARGRFHWEPLAFGEPWPGSGEYASPQEAETSAKLWGEDLAAEVEGDW